MDFELNKERILGLLRHVLTFIGGVIVWRGITDEQTVTIISGIVISAVTLYFSWTSLDKETRLDQVFGLLRHIITTLSGFGVLKGWYDEQTLLTIIGVIFGIIGGGWSANDKTKLKIVRGLERRSRAAA